MKKCALFIATLAAVVLSAVSCQTEPSITRQTVTLVVKANDFTRTSAAGFDDGDQIGIYVVNAASAQALAASGNFVNNRIFTYSSTNNYLSPLAGEDIFWSNATDSFDIYGYYPYNAELTAPTVYAFTVAADQSTSVAYFNSDFLWTAKRGVGFQTTPVEVAFDHLMSKIVIAVTGGEGFAADELVAATKSLSIGGFAIDGTINLADGTTTVGAAKRNITPLEEGGYPAIVYPQTAEMTLTLVINGISYTYTNNVVFEAGKQCNFALTVDKQAMRVTANSVTAWGETDTVNGNFSAGGVGGQGIPNNEIWHTSTDGQVVTPAATDVFGATIVSNVYETGKGIITFGGEITSIGEYAFYDCSTLYSITVPESVIAIGKSAFCRCVNLSAFYGINASSDNKGLILNGALVAFASANITEYTIPRGIISIGEETFKDCDNLITVLIPNSVIFLGYNIFQCCDSLTLIVVPDTVETIDFGAFADCTNLTTLTIGSGVKTMGKETATRSYNLSEVYCKAVTPPTLEGFGWFTGNASGRKIYVPMASVDAYKAAYGWSYYAADIVGLDYSHNLSANGNANCYIVSEAGDYSFDASVMGNGAVGLINGFHTNSATLVPHTAELKWSIPENVISNVTLTGSSVSFSSTGIEGNALIAIKDTDDNILWSWHIWCTDAPKAYSNYDGTMVLDRNLGAIGSTYEDGEDAWGLYYQWGRKDPFASGFAIVDTTISTGTIPYTISHPDTFIGGNLYYWLYSNKIDYLWGYGYNKKTIYDPCPAGYRVMNTYSSATNLVYDSSKPFGRSDGDLWYPFAKRLHYTTGMYNDNDDTKGGLYYVNSDSNGSLNDCYDLVMDVNEVMLHNLQYKAFGESVRCSAE